MKNVKIIFKKDLDGSTYTAILHEDRFKVTLEMFNKIKNKDNELVVLSNSKGNMYDYGVGSLSLWSDEDVETHTVEVEDYSIVTNTVYRIGQLKYHCWTEDW